MSRTKAHGGESVAAAYTPPTGDDPLDVREMALVRALASIIVRQIQDEAVANHQTAESNAPAKRRAG